VFDTWANVGDGELLIYWPCELNQDESAQFGRLATSLGYLGRSESWVEADLVRGNQGPPTGLNAFPDLEGTHPGRGYEQVSLMAAIPPEKYRLWHQQQTEVALAPFPLPSGKKKPTGKLLKERERAIVPYPPDLLSCLTIAVANDPEWQPIRVAPMPSHTPAS
jgi:CRISPR-associated protein Csb2